MNFFLKRRKLYGYNTKTSFRIAGSYTNNNHVILEIGFPNTVV